MTHDEIKDEITRNLQNNGVIADDVRVQQDRFGGWRVVVISDSFEEKSLKERQNIVFGNLNERIYIEWSDLLTKSEREWSEPLPIDIKDDELPLWPEALLRQNGKNAIFPSDLDDDIATPIIGTFYSLKGGVGRSTALAYTAKLLAAQKRVVLCVDMDLEAPGLAAIFGKETEITENQGVVHILYELQQGGKPDINEHIIRISDDDEIYCLPAGITNAAYANKLRYIDPEIWYRESKNPLKELLHGLSEGLTFKPDVILFDARTGLSSINAPLLFEISDISVIVFYPHPQAMNGNRELVRALLNTKTMRRNANAELTPEIRFIVSPIPAGLTKELFQRYQDRTLQWISEWMNEYSDLEWSELNDTIHYVRYSEAIAVSDTIIEEKITFSVFDPVSQWFERFLPVPVEDKILHEIDHRKNKILEELEFSSGIAEEQPRFLDIFVETDTVKQALSPDYCLVTGRKGTGKTAILRRFGEDSRFNKVVILSPQQMKQHYPWVLGPEGFFTVERILIEKNITWRSFWSIYTFMICYLSHKECNSGTSSMIRFNIEPSEPINEKSVVDWFRQIIQIEDFALLSKEWLVNLDNCAPPDTFLLYDGLDSSFGNTLSERNRRKNSIEGLFSFILDNISVFQHFKFKSLLREDIWRQVIFENKSHLHGRSVKLSWKTMEAYYKVLLKQALLSNEFRNILEIKHPGIDIQHIGDWDANVVYSCWNILVGERMKGGKAAYTYNWVWSRLSDANDDRTPRSLIQLFAKARSEEILEHKNNPNNKVIIRPKMLTRALSDVSNEMVEALNEEFPELSDLITRLKTIGRSPVDSDKIDDLSDQIDLAVEVGLLGIYEWDKDNNAARYKVPDVYLYGLNMARKGQA